MGGNVIPGGRLWREPLWGGNVGTPGDIKPGGRVGVVFTCVGGFEMEGVSIGLGVCDEDSIGLVEVIGLIIKLPDFPLFPLLDLPTTFPLLPELGANKFSDRGLFDTHVFTCFFTSTCVIISLSDFPNFLSLLPFELLDEEA